MLAQVNPKLSRQEQHMGWWRIDPATGEPAKDAQSSLSRPPEFVLLNAVPGADDDEEACYLGDGPWDMAASVADEIRSVIGDDVSLTDQEARSLLLEKRLSPRLAKLGEE